ncbi:Thiol-disulfide isomerase or thioredoxin [Chitinophaga jiangningensis]|uniref:Thiol-disulfide isomerase or thioredoxin n=1 Tax=Chitinophaga jiangningensis TaxID=1419482 RepID=A0A1M7CLZ9_9BACT|nr:TlpA disulfide reductase family protein [Chitinophaga jiangningensis]SHL68304.1 Thiol-disulfide isomerase or thioredoxin [Chitinophaga jiangningensis]
MKKYFLLLSCLVMAAVSFAQKGYTLKIKLSNNKNYMPWLVYVEGNKRKVDSTYTLEKGYMVMKGSVSEAVIASLSLKGNPALELRVDGETLPAPYLSFVLSNEVITISGDADKIFAASVKGGRGNKEWEAIRPAQQKMEEATWTAICKAAGEYTPGTTPGFRKIAGKINYANAEEERALQQSFTAQYPNSILSMYYLYRTHVFMPEDTLKLAYNKLGPDAQRSYYGRIVGDKIKSLEATAIGKTAIDLRKKDMNGQEVSLATLKGRYVLLDFWGTWCHPCRASHPHLKELYSKYKADGLEIVGIASENGSDLEKNRKGWLEAIEQDGINWVNVLNNEGIAQFDAVTAYGISAFPTKILLDKEGRIIGRWIGDSKDVDVKLKEVFGK